MEGQRKQQQMAGTVLGLGCLLAYILLSILSRAAFADYDKAFANQLALTLSADAGCLVALAAIALVRRFYASTQKSALWFFASLSAMGLCISALVKTGVVGPGNAAYLIAGDFFSAAFALGGVYVWWKILAPQGEKCAMRLLCLSFVCAAILFFPIALVPADIAHICLSIVLPLGMFLCLFPVLQNADEVERNGAEKSEASTRERLDTQDSASTQSNSSAPNKTSRTIVPLVVIAAIICSFLVADPMLDLYTVSLFFDNLISESLNQPAALCVVIVTVFCIVCLAVGEKRKLPLSAFYATGFFLTAVGYLVSPFRPMNGSPLGCSEAGRIILCLFAAVVVLRALESRGKLSEAPRVFLRLGILCFATMLACDAVIIIMQLQPGFDYSDFMFRTAFSSFGVGVLVVLIMAILPRLDAAVENKQMNAAGAGAAATGTTLGANPGADTSASAATAAVTQAGATIDTGTAAQQILHEKKVAFAHEMGLTARETEVFELLAMGRDLPYIERELVVARSTIKTHVKHIYAKCEVSSRQELLDKLDAFVKAN